MSFDDKLTALINEASTDGCDREEMLTAMEMQILVLVEEDEDEVLEGAAEVAGEHEVVVTYVEAEARAVTPGERSKPSRPGPNPDVLPQ